MHVAVVYSLPSQRLLGTKYGETDEDSAVIARMVVLALQSRGVETTTYRVAEDRIDDILEIKADCIFNLIEWCGRDIGLSQRAFACFRQLGIPVTGSSEELFVLTGDKVRLKNALQEAGVPTPGGAFFETGDEAIPDHLTYPVIVKPALEHCSIGLGYDSIAQTPAELRPIINRQIADFGQQVIAEEFIIGRELLVYLLEVGDEVKVLPIEEILFKGNNPLVFQTYESKWGVSPGQAEPEDVASDAVVAELSDEERAVVENESIKAFKKLGLRGYARFDVRLRGMVPYMLETNANSSVYDGEGELTDADQEVIFGVRFSDYVFGILDSALYHHRRGDAI
jgi:D-alanine-D-alanine ligase